MKNRRELITIFCLTILVRLLISGLVVHIFPDWPNWPTGSSVRYRIGLAEGILSGMGFIYNGVPSLYQTPVYPFFLAIIFFTVGKHWWSLTLFQGILEGISSVGIAKIGSRFSEKGWLAGVIYAIYPYGIMQSRSIVDTPLFVSLFILSILCYLKFMDDHNIVNLIMASIFLGIGTLNRASMAVIGIAFVSYMIFAKYRWKALLMYTIISGLIAVSIPFGWVLRNYHLTGHFPVFSVGGQHFMWYAHNEHIYKVLQRNESPDIIGNNPRYPIVPPISTTDFFTRSPAEQVRLGNYCSDRVRTWISSHKIEVVKYSLLKLKRFLSWEKFPAKIGQPYQDLRILIYKLINAPVTLLGWLGVIILCLKRNKMAYFIAAAAIGFVLMHVIAIGGSRHKIPLDALLISFMPFTITYICCLAAHFRGQDSLPKVS